MALIPMAGGDCKGGDDCGPKDCPTVFKPTDGMVPIQGYLRTDVATPDGEVIIEIPTDIYLDGARALGR